MRKTKSVCLLIIVIYFVFSKACPSSPNRLDSTTKGNNTVQFQIVKSGCQKCVLTTAKRVQKILKKPVKTFCQATFKKILQVKQTLKFNQGLFTYLLRTNQRGLGAKGSLAPPKFDGSETNNLKLLAPRFEIITTAGQTNRSMKGKMKRILAATNYFWELNGDIPFTQRSKNYSSSNGK